MAPLRQAFHEDQEVSKYLIETAEESKSLNIGASNIASLGSGLIAKTNIFQGHQIFKSKPLVACVDPSFDTICHYCLKGSERIALGEAIAEQPRPSLCTGCRRARFCSKDCHAKAWKLFHKDECNILRDSPNLTMTNLAVYRILFWKKRNYISNNVASVLSLLEDHFDEYSDSEAGDVLFEFASSIRATANTNVALSVVLRLLPAIQTNAIKMRQAEKSGSFGIALDLISCAINHSCLPNAFLYVEDGYITARAIRYIPNGEEITVSYGDPMLPLTTRRDYLKVEYFFTCFCQRCEADKRELKAMVGGSSDDVKAVHAVQEMLVQLTNKTVLAIKNPNAHKEFEDLARMERDIVALSQRIIKGVAWPEHLDPMPLVRNNLALLYLSQQKLLPATRNALRSTLMARWRNGPDWVNNLCTLVQCLAALAAGDPDEPHFTSGGFLSLKETQRAVRGYGMQLCKDAGIIFGGSSICKYTDFLCEWFSWVAKTAEPPGPGTKEFADMFFEVQKKLLAWADIDLAFCINPGLAMPDTRDVAKKGGILRRLLNPDNFKNKNGEGLTKKETVGGQGA